MLLDLFLNNVWLAIGLWCVMYLMDYVLTLKAAHMYQAGANKHFKFAGGYELNPFFKEDIAFLRRFSPRFWLLLLLVSGLLFVLHSLNFPPAFAFAWGLLIGIQIAIHCRHVHNLMVFHYAVDSNGVGGYIEYQHWLSLRLSSIGLFSFSIVFLFLFLFLGTFFLLGTAVGCFTLALRHYLDSAKANKALPQTEG
jgi:hypothetical protein